MTLKRIHREVADLKKEDLGTIVLTPSDDNLFLWKGSIPGPEGSMYEGGVFNFEVVLPADYPYVHLLFAPLLSALPPSGSLHPRCHSKRGRLR